MIEKLKLIEKKYNEINEKLMSPEVMNDLELYKKLMKESKMLSPIVEKYLEYSACDRLIVEAKEILASSDSELKELAEAELEESKEKLLQINDDLRVLLLPKDPNDDRNVIIEIRGGAGGEEAALFASVLYRMYSMYAETKGYKTELNYLNETELGGFKEVSFMVEGFGAYSRFKFESGVHRVQRVPETEASGRIHTSTVTVAVLPEADDVEIEINTEDLEITRHRSAGAGGQHVNKTESAIRIIHIPTGIEVDCQDERSQNKNKDKAMKILKSRIYELERAKVDKALSTERKSQVGTGDRSERIRTYNYPQGRVSDHRIGLTLYYLENFLNGKLDEMIDALITADRAEQLKANTD
ncbi:MAG: peptide chain release factor 1 [Clostridiales bacterium GWF2_38_85]|nr:MAG: peptide chain release factor 1 [Clostridiales bacterium GWF2_38_85]HBL83734.1 peptide chain release factor 1 [Clostridiales bacterium]